MQLSLQKVFHPIPKSHFHSHCVSYCTVNIEYNNIPYERYSTTLRSTIPFLVWIKSRPTSLIYCYGRIWIIRQVMETEKVIMKSGGFTIIKTVSEVPITPSLTKWLWQNLHLVCVHFSRSLACGKAFILIRFSLQLTVWLPPSNILPQQ